MSEIFLTKSEELKANQAAESLKKEWDSMHLSGRMALLNHMNTIMGKELSDVIREFQKPHQLIIME